MANQRLLHRGIGDVKDWISLFADIAVVAIDAMAVLIIAVGTLEMFVTCVRSVFNPSRTGRDLRDGYLRYARWLIAGLTFQLANDIIVSARAPTWEDIGRLAAIAFIRTFLNFFLERDIVEAGKFPMDEDPSRIDRRAEFGVVTQRGARCAPPSRRRRVDL